MNRLSGALFAAGLCAVILYAEIQNVDLSEEGVSAMKYAVVWILTGIVFFLLERCCTYKLMLPRLLTFGAIYLAAPVLTGICSMKGMETFTSAALMIAVPSAAVHTFLIFAARGIKKPEREN